MDLEKIKSKCKRNKKTGCLEWQGGQNGQGYPGILFRGKSRSGNRVVWILSNGEITKNKYILQSCDNRLCIEILHLRIGTHKENMNDMAIRGRHWSSKKKECKNGHPFNEANTLKSSNRRSCRACIRIAWRVSSRYKGIRKTKLDPGHIPGVSFKKRDNVWSATLHGKYIGTFKTQKAAADALKQ